MTEIDKSRVWELSYSLRDQRYLARVKYPVRKDKSAPTEINADPILARADFKISPHAGIGYEGERTSYAVLPQGTHEGENFHIDTTNWLEPSGSQREYRRVVRAIEKKKGTGSKRSKFTIVRFV